MIDHTLYKKTINWRFIGKWNDENGELLDIEGNIRVKERENDFFVEKTLNFLNIDPIVATNAFIINKFNEVNSFTNWEMFGYKIKRFGKLINTEVDSMQGRLVALDNTIWMTGASKDKKLTIEEVYVYKNKNYYMCRGITFRNNLKVAWWIIDMLTEN